MPITFTIITSGDFEHHYKLMNDPHQNPQDPAQPTQTSYTLLRRLRIVIAIVTVVMCSYNVRTTAITGMRHSRNLHRLLNSKLLQHNDLDIYWFGYRSGQYLINYPIHQYYFVEEFGQFLSRVQQVMGNLEELYSFGLFDQLKFNSTMQKIIVYDGNGDFQQYNWTIAQGFTQPFTPTDLPKLRETLLNSLALQISIQGLQIRKRQDQLYDNQVRQWGISLLVETFSYTSIFVTVVLHEKLYTGYGHILHLVLGMVTLVLFGVELNRRQSIGLPYYYKRYQSRLRKLLQAIQATDTPDILVIFFLLYSSFACLVNLLSVRLLLLLDGITCFICWLYILKLNTENQNYHISFLIKKCYIFVGRLFVSFGPMFIGFCLFALTAFCRYTDLFVSFHKTFISLFSVCYYNMTYEEFRTTERTNPISTIFFTLLIMIFTVCIYSGMLVSVFCSYMWNRRQNKNKEQLMHSLKIQCRSCDCKYSYQEGYQASLQSALKKKQSQILDTDDDDQNIITKYRNSLRERIKYLGNQMLGMLEDCEIGVTLLEEECIKIQQEYRKILMKGQEDVGGLLRQLENEEN